MTKTYARILLLALLTLSSCRRNQQVDGGPCSYTLTNYPATILEIYRIDSARSDMILIANMEGHQDTIYFSRAARQYISNAELQNNNLKPGDTLNYQHKQITSGSCNPDIFFLTKERFKK